MIKALETVIESYSAFRNYILWGTVVVFLCILVKGLCHCKKEGDII